MDCKQIYNRHLMKQRKQEKYGYDKKQEGNKEVCSPPIQWRIEGGYLFQILTRVQNYFFFLDACCFRQCDILP